MKSDHSYLRLCVAFCIASLTVGGCKDKSQNSSWNGRWSLNMSKSQVYGAYFSVRIAANGQVTVTNDTHSFSFLCNGKQEFKIGVNQSTVCTDVSEAEWKMTGRSTGKYARISVWDISSNGQTLTTRSRERHPDSSQIWSEKVFTRRGGTNGFAGRWQDTAALASRPKTLDVELSGHRLHLAYLDTGQYSDSPLDGSIVPIRGPRIRSGFVISASEISPRKIYTQVMLSGRVIREGTLEISHNRTMLQESWRPENPDEKDRLVYDKR